jgi:dihydrodipicolinate synthase/N-acetylneuraminate lyase
MSSDTAEEIRSPIERRTFLQLAGAAAVAGAVGAPTQGFAAPSKAYVPGVSTTEYDRMFVASVTPFKPGSEDIDFTAFRSFMRYWAEPGSSTQAAPLSCRRKPAAFYLTQQEAAARRLPQAGDKTLVFSGVMQTTTRACIEEAKALKSAGVHGLFLMPPIGTIDVVAAWDPNKNPEVWGDQLRAIADAVNLPVIIHPTGGKFFALPLEPAMKIVDSVPQIVGYKMITDDFAAMAKALRAYTKRHVAILPAGAAAMHGAIVDGYVDGTVVALGTTRWADDRRHSRRAVTSSPRPNDRTMAKLHAWSPANSAIGCTRRTS